MSTAEIGIRRARRRDLEAVIELGAALARHVEDKEPAWTPSDLEPLMFGKGRWCDVLVAAKAGDVVGAAIVSRVLQLHEGLKKLYLADLTVAPAAKGTGAGRALMAAVARHALDLGASAVFWDVWTGNAEAYRFYDRLGASRDDQVVTVMSLDAEGLVRLLHD